MAGKKIKDISENKSWVKFIFLPHWQFFFFLIWVYISLILFDLCLKQENKQFANGIRKSKLNLRYILWKQV